MEVLCQWVRKHFISKMICLKWVAQGSVYSLGALEYCHTSVGNICPQGLKGVASGHVFFSPNNLLAPFASQNCSVFFSEVCVRKSNFKSHIFRPSWPQDKILNDKIKSFLFKFLCNVYRSFSSLNIEVWVCGVTRGWGSKDAGLSWSGYCQSGKIKDVMGTERSCSQ